MDLFVLLEYLVTIAAPRDRNACPILQVNMAVSVPHSVKYGLNSLLQDIDGIGIL